MSDNLTNPIIYKGPSMNPTLKNLDILIVVPYGNRKVRKGDVITFRTPNRELSITHRVISVDDKGVRTLGDNNSFPDEYLLQCEDILGRVEYAERKNRRIKIYGGTIGHIYAKIIRTIRWIKLAIIKILKIFRPIYRFFHRSGLLARFVPSKMKLKTIYYEREDGIELHLLMGKWLIGRINNKRKDWDIKLPFRLFVQEKELIEVKKKFLDIVKNQQLDN